MFECQAAIETLNKIHPVQFNTGWVQVNICAITAVLLFFFLLWLFTYIPVTTQCRLHDLQNQIGRAYLELGDFEHARQGTYEMKMILLCILYFSLFVTHNDHTTTAWCVALEHMLRIEPYRMTGLDLLSTTLWHLKRDVSNFESSHENGWWWYIMIHLANSPNILCMFTTHR